MTGLGMRVLEEVHLAQKVSLRLMIFFHTSLTFSGVPLSSMIFSVVGRREADLAVAVLEHPAPICELH